jgi:hypothetical protein
MTEREQLLQAVNELEATFRQSAELGNANFRNNRKEAVQLRRVISDRLASISTIGAAAFADTEMLRPFQSEFSRMRSTMALHHASWPIVMIDLDDQDYLASAMALRESNSRFIGWVRTAVSASR